MLTVTKVLSKESPTRFYPATPSIIKIMAGDKFYIAKTSSVEWLIKEIKDSYFKYSNAKLDDSKLFYPLVKHLYQYSIDKISIEVLKTSDKGYQLLKFELEQLIEHFGTKNCLNKNNIPYIPKTKMAKTGGHWLTQNEALNFRKLLTKYEY